jgi:hypothetical protein
MHFGFVALYAGPDQLMPLASSLAAIVGFLLMFWGKVMMAFDKVVRYFKGTPAEPVAAEPIPAVKTEVKE